MFTFSIPTNLIGVGIVVPFYSHAIFLTPNRKITYRLIHIALNTV